MCHKCIEADAQAQPALISRRDALTQIGVGSAAVAALSSTSAAFALATPTGEIPSVGYAMLTEGKVFERYKFKRRALNSDDVLVDIHYCGICHSDIHFAKNDFGYGAYPALPGHEIVGRVSAVGSGVTKFKAGDPIGVGCMVDSCGECEFCKAGQEQYCARGNTQTYGRNRSGGNNLGGYANKIVVKERFGIKIPASMDLASTAPLLCAGITTMSPLEHWNIGEGSKLAVVGLGGLGHVAVKLAASRGADVTVLTTTENKRKDALAMGASEAVLWPDEQAFGQMRSRFDKILTTIPYGFDPNPFIALLNTGGTMINVGLLSAFSKPVNNVWLLAARKSLSASAIGGVADTQRMIEYCASRNIKADIELIKPTEIDRAYERVINKDVRYRFVIDMRNTA